MIKEEKILQIIEEQTVFTVKLENRNLMEKVQKMCSQGKAELKDSFRDCYYFGKPDRRRWSLKDGYEDEMYV